MASETFPGLKDKRILVTGASGGIGFQLAVDFLKSGAQVGAHFSRNRNSVQRLMGYAGPGQCQIFQADFSRSSAVNQLWKEYIDWSKGIDVLVNNAAATPTPIPIGKLDDAAWDETFQVNVKAPFYLSRAALSVMEKQRSGRIINISSIGLKFGGGANSIHYSASKAALEALTLSFSKAGAPFNVLVNTVRAGVTDTPFHEKTGRQDLASRADLIPLKRLAKPEEISHSVLFLASEAASFITGSTLTVAGGE